ncbi:MAG: RAMP superfamily CRISPR-associated protein [Archaeoglobales archaeon]|nr:RAMP superfamily CRISPR-associated protein [Archaeoglobales archaeon]
MKGVFLVELETLEPVVIVAKKGKTKFFETAKYIPASSIAGALARKSILENVRNNLGNCKNLESPNKIPECSNCPENCDYRKIWINKELKLTNAVFGEWDSKSPGIPELQSACESRRKAGKEAKKDQLLYLFLERLFWSGKANLEKIEEVRKEGYKKSLATFNGKEFKNVTPMQFTRVAIDEKLKSSKENMLYGFTAIKDEQKFRFLVFCEKDLADIFNGEIKIGAWKSRGMGLVRLKIVEKYDENKFIEKRTKEIREGFEKIYKLFGEKIGEYYGTYTYLTEGTQKLDLEIVFRLERIRRSLRYERKDKGYFILADTINSGSAGVFYARDPEKTAEELAKQELKILSQPWFDWLYFNHPVHYEFSVLNGGGRS